MRQTKTTKEENAAVKSLVINFLDLQEKFKREEEAFKKERAEFQTIVREFMGKNGMTKFKLKSPRGSKFSVSDVRPKKIVWLLDRLKEKLPKTVLNSVIDKTYTVNDWDGFKDYMKAIGANPKVLISYFDVEEKLNESALDEAAQAGTITEEDLEGCYEIKENEGYIRITELEL